VVPSRR